MDQITTPQSNNNANTCEAIGCSANATTQINVAVGDLGTIHLLLCNGCKPRFTDPHMVDDSTTSKIIGHG